MAMAKKISELKLNPKAMFYACVLEDLRKVAAKCGYALAIHGSLQSDLDLIAVRWNDNYESPLHLVEELISVIGHTILLDEDSLDLTNPEKRFGNQIHYTIPILGDWFIDLTIITNNY